MKRTWSTLFVAMFWILPSASRAEHVAVRLPWPATQTAAAQPEVLSATLGSGTPVTRREPVSEMELVVAGQDAEGRERYRVVVADPAQVRGEIFDAVTGELARRSDVTLDVDELRLDLPLDTSVRRLALYRPRFEGETYRLEPIAEFALGEPTAAVPSQQAEAIGAETLLANGSPSNRVDLVFVGDGYTAAELDKYAQDVQNVLSGYLGISPYASYAGYFNAYRVDVVSNESGADHPERGEFRDTALDSRYACDGNFKDPRLLCASSAKAQAAAAAALPDPAQRDIVLVVVNDAQYGGSGGPTPVISTDPSAVFLALHEIGHSFGLLADEYTDQPPPCNLSEPLEANSTTVVDRARIKWAHWIDASTLVPTPPGFGGTPGLYEGSRYCPTGMYRPTPTSMMKVLGEPFFAINEEQLVKRLYAYTFPVDATLPPAGGSYTPAPGQNMKFILSTPPGNNLRVDWYLNSSFRVSGKGYTVPYSQLIPGQINILYADVYDVTGRVRNDPGHVTQTTLTWYIDLNFLESQPAE